MNLTQQTNDRGRGILGGLFRRGRAGEGRAAKMARRAGRATHTGFEPLEARQLLFTLTVTPESVNPQTGTGTVHEFFGYLAPYLAPTQAIQIQEDQAGTEDFNQALPQGVIFGNIPPTGVIFPQSGLQIRHTIEPASDAQVRGDGQSEAAIRLRAQAGESFNFRVISGNVVQAMRFFEIDAFADQNGSVGLPIANMRVSLLFGGAVIASYEGAAAIDDFNLTFPNQGVGVGRFRFQAPATPGQAAPAFDEIRFEVVAGTTNEGFFLDNASWALPPGNFASMISSHIFGVWLTLSGPVGASVQVLDLYGREMVATLFLDAPPNSSVPNVDRNDDGIGEFNDGIGRVIITNADARTSISMVGGTISIATTASAAAEEVEPIAGGFANFFVVENYVGFYDDFETAGIGYVMDTQGQRALGLPTGPGSVIIGAPWLRPQNNYNPAGQAANIQNYNFSRADQGIFATDGSSVGEVYVHGIVHGSSRFTGALHEFAVGFLPGSLAVDGDLNRLIVGSEAGQWTPDPQNSPIAVAVYRTDSQLVVGRTLGQVHIAGRSNLDITVAGDLSNPTLHRPGLAYRYFEIEDNYGIRLDNPERQQAVIKATQFNTYGHALDLLASEDGLPYARVAHAAPFGLTHFRNDSILSAEWVGSAGTAAEVHGDLGFGDPINTNEDPSDVYAFASDGSAEIVLQLRKALPGVDAYVRLMDYAGRTVAGGDSFDLIADRYVLRYQPTQPGVYYVVVSAPRDGSVFAGRIPYVLGIGGIAPTTFGAYRVGGASGVADANTGASNSITVLNGSMGAIRVGTGYINGGGGEADPSELMNFPQEAGQDGTDNRMMFESGSFSMPGNLYQILTGGDIGNQGRPVFNRTGAVAISVGGDFGVLLTGQSPVIGVSPEEGDVGNFLLDVGGRIAGLDIRGALGLEQDREPLTAPPPFYGPDSIVIQTGRRGGNGDVGFIRVGAHMGGDTFILRTSPRSTIGSFLVSQDIPFTYQDNFYGIYGGLRGAVFNVGSGSDVRFVDFPRLDLENSQNVTIQLIGGQPVELVDDAGARVRIEIPGAPNGVPLGDIRVLPVDGSQGAAIGHIRVNLTGGLQLRITGLTQGGATEAASIGKIEIVGADVASSILLTGSTEIDVFRIIQTGGDGFGIIENRTPGGDLVAVDMIALANLTIQSGDLGRTQVPAWGPRLIGPHLGVAAGDGGVNGALGVSRALIHPDWNGGLYRAANNVNVATGTALLDDLGSPLNPYLNGLAVRSGSVGTVSVSGVIGGVYVAAGDLNRVIANSDRISLNGRFEGIDGVIFARDIIEVDLGDGLAARAQSPISTSGIFATDDIFTIRGTRPGAFISSTITAANVNATDRFDANFDTDGIERIELTGGGDYREAWISTEFLDGFWSSFFNYDEALAVRGHIEFLGGLNADMVRSDVITGNLETFSLTGGVFDASAIGATGTATRIEAVEFRNSTREGTLAEFHVNQIVIGQNLGVLTTFGGAGDISDLRVDVIGSVTGSITGRNLTRVRLEVDNTIELVSVRNDFRGSLVNTGALRSMAVTRNVAASGIFVSGALTSLTADSIINSTIEVTGPDGRIQALTSRGNLSGSIAASGPINLISSTQGDISARITTTTDRGNIGTISAARDLNITVDASGTITSLIAGRNVGTRDSDQVILVRGTLGGLNVSNGQLFSDLRVGQSISGVVTIGAASNLPGQQNLGDGSIIAYGRIESVVLNGDFNADIVSFAGGIGSVVINDGSFLPGNRIAAYEGDLTSLVVNRGHLLGDVFAEFTIGEIRVVASDDGVFGDIGLNPDLSAATPATPTRNQLPPGLAPDASIQGPEIIAGRNINNIIVTNGSIFEVTIRAGYSIFTINVNGGILTDSFTSGMANRIIAADVIHRVEVAGGLANTIILAGIQDLGADNAPGHNGDPANFDRVKFGRVRSVVVGGDAYNVRIAAGMLPGTDGIYNTADDAHALGLSFVDSVRVAGSVTLVSAFADTGPSDLSPGIVQGGRRTPVAGKVLEPVNIDRDPNTGIPIWSQLGVELTPGTPFSFTHRGVTGTILFTGPGFAIWDEAGGRLVVSRTTIDSNVFITGLSGPLVDFDVQSNDDANLGTLVIEADLGGDSDVIIDGYLREFRAGHFSGTGSIMVGNDIQLLELSSFTGGSLNAIFVRRVRIAEHYNAVTTINGSESVTIGGNFSGLFSLERNLSGAFAVGGTFQFGTLRAGGSVGTITAATMDRSRVSVRDNITTVTIGGNMFDSAIMAGFDLGRDGQFGGTALSADQTTTGTIGAVNVGGNFRESDVAAGINRGPDGFFGTSDDTAADGRSTIGAVTIGGTQVGSGNGSESYRVIATGGVASVTLAGAPVNRIGNFEVVGLPTQPLPIRVVAVQVSEASRLYTASILFNQPMDAASLPSALSVSEVRGVSGEVRIRLFEGVDYTLSYDATRNAAIIDFNPAITQRNLPQTSGVPGPGIYRFDLSADFLRAQVIGARLDGDADGFASPGDHYSADDIIGDAGDKRTAETVVLTNPQNNQPVRIDAYGPIDLNIVLDDNLRSDGVADTNTVFTIRGSIGDHPDHDVNLFRFAGDIDVYRITLQAGQILRLGPPSGAAAQLQVVLFDNSGATVGGPNSAAMDLPAPLPASLSEPIGQHFLVRETGTFYLVAAATLGAAGEFDSGGGVPNPNVVAGAVGDYAFTVEVFDDGDSGFAAPTDAGNGNPIISAPSVQSFAGPDGRFGTADDFTTQVLGEFTFRLELGEFGTHDDVVVGNNGAGVEVRLATGPDGLHATADDVRTISIASAIGHRGHSGVPGDISPDVDIYHLNNRLPIQPGTKMKITVRLADIGADLGSNLDPLVQPFDYTGQVQLGFFETTGSNGIDDGTLVFAPSDFIPTSGTPGVIASDGSTTYGFDDGGNFYVEFVTPGRLDGDPNAPAPASYAVYLQGVYNADYELEVQYQELGLARVRKTQNILIETRGGVVDWLEATGVQTGLTPFDARALGFTGRIGGQPVNDYIVQNLVTRLNAVFAAAGVDVNVSANPAAFEFQPRSTIFLTSTNDPINFFSDEIYGYSERSDVLNADQNDQAVVFVPTLAPLGYQPSQNEIDDLVGSLVAAVGRRAGELMGLRITVDAAGGGFGTDIMADNSVREQGNVFSPFNRRLSHTQDILIDTDFYLGEQNSGSLLRFLLLPELP